MRDLLISLLVLGLLPWIFMRPHVGVLVYAWLSLMNPHRLAYGFAYSLPFGMVVALATVVSMLISSERKRLPWSGTLVVWLIYVFWLNVTTFFALEPDMAMQEWDRAIKIQLMVLVTLLLMHGRRRIDAFVWVIVLSVGFFGIKGGIFSAMTGGQYLVMGPAESFISENNTLALALIMVLPLMRYLMVSVSDRRLRLALVGAIALTTMSILSSHSRGALLAGATILVFLILKSRYKVRFIIAAAIALPLMLLSMPDAWFERMGTISGYEQDQSAMGRINAWWFAFNIAKDHPITGGGFGVFSENLFLTYAPNPLNHHDAHSIYFEVLGEHGFVGLGLFLLLALLAFRSCTWVIRKVRERDDLLWARDLAAMLQVCLIGYAVGGAFLGLAYYDLYYNLVAVIILLRHHIHEELKGAVDKVETLEDEHPEGSTVLPGKAESRRRRGYLGATS